MSAAYTGPNLDEFSVRYLDINATFLTFNLVLSRFLKMFSYTSVPFNNRHTLPMILDYLLVYMRVFLIIHVSLLPKLARWFLMVKRFKSIANSHY